MHSITNLPDTIDSELQLDDLLSEPSQELIAFIGNLEGDIMVVGIGGKMGLTLGRMAVRAIKQAGVRKTVYGASRFSDIAIRRKLDELGITTICCDLLDSRAVAGLKAVENVIYMAGRKFGTTGGEELTWATNTLAPAYTAQAFAGSRIVVFSTGCVYPLVTFSSGGCTENVPPSPVGEYAQSCLGREWIFAYFTGRFRTKTCFLRLNYAIDLRYGVLHDIASRIARDEPVDISVGHVNMIWQGDANDYALRALSLCDAPPRILNVTGPEIVSVRQISELFGSLLGRKVVFTGTPCDAAYLSNASYAFETFGDPRVSLDRMISWTAAWIRSGGRSFDIPTHYEVNTGRF